MSNIKERVLSIAESKSINKTDFFKELGLSYANFKGIQKNSALSSDAVAIILAKHVDIDPTWLIIGEGSMYREGATPARDQTEHYTSAKRREPKDKVVVTLERLVNALELTVKSQQKTISYLENKNETSGEESDTIVVD